LDHGFPGLQQLHDDPLLRAVATRLMKSALTLQYFLSRTLHPGAAPQALHIDCDPGESPLLGFIWMLDDFTAQNGATSFVAGSHKGAPAPTATLALAPAGSMIMYDRSVLHGYTTNSGEADRRSIQGGFSAH
jgi:ectoine hydroxylase-related dioxygenase (phytanoyl-CoA dioxygenase family)